MNPPFLPTLLGHFEKQEKHDLLYWEFYEQGGKQAIRYGDWKYVKLNVRDPSKPTVAELYNLKNDVLEKDNIISYHQELIPSLDSLMNYAHVPHDLISLFPIDEQVETTFN